MKANAEKAGINQPAQPISFPGTRFSLLFLGKLDQAPARSPTPNAIKLKKQQYIFASQTLFVLFGNICPCISSVLFKSTGQKFCQQILSLFGRRCKAPRAVRFMIETSRISKCALWVPRNSIFLWLFLNWYKPQPLYPPIH